MINSDLELIYSFKVKRMSYESSVVNTKDHIIEIKKLITKKEYSSFGDSPNQENIKNQIEQVLKEVRLKPII